MEKEMSRRPDGASAPQRWRVRILAQPAFFSKCSSGVFLSILLGLMVWGTASGASSMDVSVSGQPELAITMTDSPDPVSPGDALNLAISVRNAGDAVTRKKVTLYTTLPQGTSFLSASTTSGKCSKPKKKTPGLVKCNLGKIMPEQEVHLSVNARVPEDCSSTLSAIATVDPLNAIQETNEDNNIATSQTRCARPISITVRGQVVLDTGEPAVGADVEGTLVTEEELSSLRSARIRQLELKDWTRIGFKERKVFPIIHDQMALRGLQKVATTTDSNGEFSLILGPSLVPVRINLEIKHQVASDLPIVQTSKWGNAESDILDMGTIIIPDPRLTEMPVSGGEGVRTDGSIRVENVPEEVNRLFGRSYDPGETPEAFPGEFAEMASIPLNSSVFLWMEALDAQGNPVDDLSQAVKIRARVPRSQWADLEDINSGTDRIEVPIYVFNEATGMWQQSGVGWLEDGNRTILPEDAQSVILDGTFQGEIFATFVTNHFSWMNVDYPYIGPWTLSRLDSARRNNDCLYAALQLASAIAGSEAGRQAYARVNQPGADLSTELGDGMGPELKNKDLVDAYGQYDGDAGGSETEFAIANAIWDGCGENATEEQKKNTILIMAVTILHETAHWKDDVKKYPQDDTDTPGEEGNQLERDIFGGVITLEGGVIKRDGQQVDPSTRDRWLDPQSWPSSRSASLIDAEPVEAKQASPSLELTISLSRNTFDLGEEIPVEVTYRNISSSPIQVMNKVVLEGWPLYFEIINSTSRARVRFLGPEVKLALSDSDFTTLGPGETLTQTVNLRQDPTSGRLHYQLIRSGTYELTAVYEQFRGVAETRSNTLTFTLNPGGSVSGRVTNASNGQPISEATVRAMVNNNLIASATTDQSGNYQIPELPPGDYVLEVQASGFLRTRQNVSVVAGQNVVLNFSLSPLLAAGEIRIVLTWGEYPRDLDSHLWLPAEKPYHVYYGRKGSLIGCPFANLDVDDMTSYGPETVTIKERFTGKYVYAVYNYSRSPDITTSEARVQVFDSTGLIATFNIPTQGTGLWWYVMDIDGATGAITEINRIGDSPEPYPDTTAGCP